METSAKAVITDDWQDFLNFITSKAEALGDVNKVKQGNSLKEKIEVCYNTDYIYNGLKKWLILCLQRPTVEKNSSISKDYRLKGNSYVESNNNVSALNCYNKSIFYAPKDSDELRSAYGNRSFILMEMKLYSECVQDIDRALHENQPSLRKLKLLARKGQALNALAMFSEAVLALEKSLDIRKNMNEEFKRKTLKLSSEIEVLIKKIKSDNEENVNIRHPISNTTILKRPNLKFEENSSFRNASKAVRLVSNKTKGRYIIANENIKVGDVLFAERPFAFVVLPERYDKYCSYCCKSVLFPVPCEACPLECYCSDSCKNLAFECFHKWECGGLEICYSIGVVHLSLRVALLGLQDDNKDKYKEVTNLMAHIEESSTSDLFNYAVTATLMTMYLEEKTNLFEGQQRREKLLDFGGVILLHIAQLICNGHAITDIETEYDSASSLLVENQIRVATAIYLSASMMNHSCDPSIVNSFYESLLIVRASKDIKKGDEVYNCYGPMVQKMEYEERKEILLTQYMFDCDCIGCVKKIGPTSGSIICETCSAPLIFGNQFCSGCSKKIDILSLKSDINAAINYYNEGSNLFKNGKILDSSEYFKKSLALYQKHCHKNHQQILQCRDSLAQVYAHIGQEEEAYKFIAENIECIEDIYGNTAVEVGQEVLKLLTVGTNIANKNKNLSTKNRKILENCVSIGEKGKFIIELSYGDWHPRYNDFCKHLDYLSLCIKK